jgi:hypothetical protein
VLCSGHWRSLGERIETLRPRKECAQANLRRPSSTLDRAAARSRQDAPCRSALPGAGDTADRRRRLHAGARRPRAARGRPGRDAPGTRASVSCPPNSIRPVRRAASDPSTMPPPRPTPDAVAACSTRCRPRPACEPRVTSARSLRRGQVVFDLLTAWAGCLEVLARVAANLGLAAATALDLVTKRGQSRRQLGSVHRRRVLLRPIQLPRLQRAHRAVSRFRQIEDDGMRMELLAWPLPPSRESARRHGPSTIRPPRDPRRSNRLGDIDIY